MACGLLLPPLHRAYQRPGQHAALEAAASVIALLAFFLVFGRLRRHGRLNELMLAAALAVLTAQNLLLVAPVLVALPDGLAGSAQVAGGLAASLLFLLAVVLPRRRMWQPDLCDAATAGWAVGVLVATVAAVTLALSGLMQGLTVTDSLADRFAHWAQALMAVLYAAAAAGFWLRAPRVGDTFYKFLSVGSFLGAAVHLMYIPHPVQLSQWVSVGDAVKFTAYAVLLVGSMYEIQSYWRALTSAAVADERRRLARNLHDGLAQELAYLARNLSDQSDSIDEQALSRLRKAIMRAQRQSREVVTTLAAAGTQALDVALSEEASAVAERCGIRLGLDLAGGIRLPAARAEALVRIACEAITNAAKHGHAERVALVLERRGAGVRMLVRDSGTGFDASMPGEGFGLVSMRERARLVGGELVIRSEPGRGSEVEVVV